MLDTLNEMYTVDEDLTNFYIDKKYLGEVFDDFFK